MRFVAFILLELLAIGTVNISFCNGRAHVGCINSEREALLKFKHDLVDPQHRLVSWNSSTDGNCCTWAGVVCDNSTGHVLKLNLRNPFDYWAAFANFTKSMLFGKINPSLLDLKHLNYLDLSGNNFEGIQIPMFFGSMQNLRYLNLSIARFAGMISYQLGNLSHLQSLDLSSYQGMLFVENFQWLSGLYSLKYLRLNGVNLSKTSDLMLVINTLPSLKVLLLSSCQLHHFSPPSLLNFSSLSTLDLSYNQFDNSSIPKFFGSMQNLRYLYLNLASFAGMVPYQLGNLSHLQSLDLSSYQGMLFVDNFQWLSGLYSLKYLRLNGVNLSKTSDLMLVINTLPSLKVLLLSSCQLHHFSPPSLLNFSSLSTLDLSYNQFDNSSIPKFFGSMQNLRYLYLNLASFAGMVPYQLGNLSHLQSLDLSSYQGMLFVDNFQWLSGLYSLKYLRLNGVNLSKASDLMLVINTLPSLKVLLLSSCQLHHFSPPSLLNFSSLSTLDLSYNQFDNSLIPSSIFGLKSLVFLYLRYNNFQGPIPDGLQNLTSLRYIDLAYNNLSSSIPNWLYNFNGLEYFSVYNNSLQVTISDSVGNLTSLKSLDLSFNQIEGRIPSSFGKLCNLRILVLIDVKLSQDISEILNIISGCVLDGLEFLDLSRNQIFGHLTDELGQFKNLKALYLSINSISGPIPSCLGKLSSLIYLELSLNNLNGTLSEIHFEKLTKLIMFYIQDNSLTLKVGPSWVPPFQLEFLGLRSCHLGSQFPSWLQFQKSIVFLDLSNSGIIDSIPSVFWNAFPQVIWLNLSRNQIHGKVPNLVEVAPRLELLDLSSNNLSGPLPLTSIILRALDLSNNSFSGSISHFLSCGMNESKRLQILNLGDNLLSGKLPDCWKNLQYLFSLNLENNKFVGNLPTSVGALSYLQSLHLRKNNFSGTIPLSLQNCTSLSTLDISENEFAGYIPSWIGLRFSRMVILNLRSNKFHGPLPMELCHLASLQILDLANNNLSGFIPKCLNNLSAMITMNGGNYIMLLLYYYHPEFRYAGRVFLEDALVVMKGTTREYDMNLNLLRSIDLSHNNLSGEIPTEVTKLGSLQSFNLSQNSFTGRIPESIGAMRSLESVDFSTNQLSGEIPQSISDLTFLGYLNLSNNNLIGKIPSCTQLEGFNASCFTGNELCGAPLPKMCGESVPTPDQESGEGQDDNEDEKADYWFYASIALGFVVGFWGLIGPLVVNRRWRYRYCHFLDRCLGNRCVAFVRKCL